MEIKKLKVFNFRNLQEQEIEFSAGVNLIIGNNAQGKTSIIEAIDLLSRGKSFRTSNLKEIIAHDNNSLSVFATVNNIQDFELGLSIDNNHKTAYYNGNKLPSFSSLYGRLPSITFNPDDILIIKGGPDLRRNLIDKPLFETDKDFIKSYLDYKKLIKNKLSILKSDYCDKNDISIINKIISEHILKITNSRLQLIEKLNSRVREIHPFYCNNEIINLNLDSKFKDLDQDQVYELLEGYLDREVVTRSCLVGSHRDDLIIDLNGKNTRNYASQGQSRSCILSIKLSILGYLDDNLESLPIVLLDDVNAELDQGREQAFFDLILSEKYQIFITSTEDFFKEKADINHVRRLAVSDGKVS